MNSFKKFYSWAVAGMLWWICFLNFADRQVIYSIFPLLEKEFLFSKFQLGFIGSFSFLFFWRVGCYSLFGFLGPTIMGAIISFGKTGSSMSRMSAAFSWSAIFYGLATLFLIGSFLLSRRKL